MCLFFRSLIIWQLLNLRNSEFHNALLNYCNGMLSQSIEALIIPLIPLNDVYYPHLSLKMMLLRPPNTITYFNLSFQRIHDLNSVIGFKVVYDLICSANWWSRQIPLLFNLYSYEISLKIIILKCSPSSILSIFQFIKSIPTLLEHYTYSLFVSSYEISSPFIPFESKL